MIAGCHAGGVFVTCMSSPIASPGLPGEVSNEVRRRGREADSAAEKYNNEVAKKIMEQCLADGKTITGFMYKVIDMIHDEDGTFITDPNDPRIQELLDGTLEIEDIEVILA